MKLAPYEIQRSCRPKQSPIGCSLAPLSDSLTIGPRNFRRIPPRLPRTQTMLDPESTRSTPRSGSKRPLVHALQGSEVLKEQRH